MENKEISEEFNNFLNENFPNINERFTFCNIIGSFQNKERNKSDPIPIFNYTPYSGIWGSRFLTLLYNVFNNSTLVPVGSYPIPEPASDNPFNGSYYISKNPGNSLNPSNNNKCIFIYGQTRIIDIILNKFNNTKFIVFRINTDLNIKRNFPNNGTFKQDLENEKKRVNIKGFINYCNLIYQQESAITIQRFWRNILANPNHPNGKRYIQKLGDSYKNKGLI